LISVDASNVIADLEKYFIETTRKLEHMVRGFSYIISQTAIANTPIGNSEQYFKLYELRQIRLGLEPEEGFAKGSWQVSSNGQFSVQELYSVNSGSTALSLIKSDLAGYKLGQDVYIGNKGFYITQLNNGYSNQAPLGIMQPTLETIMASYMVDLKRLFNEG